LRYQPDEARSAIDDNERRLFEPLSEDGRERVPRAVASNLQAGDISPNLDDSLLGLDWSLFHARTFPGQEEDTTHRTPPEFVSYALSALDAYVIALLDGAPSNRPGTTLDCSCSLTQDATGRLQMELKTNPCQTNISWRWVMMTLLNSFPKLLRARGIKANEIAYLREGNYMKFDYPGQMVVNHSSYLCNRPLELWPCVALVLPITDELVERAKKITEFVRSDGTGGGVAHH
jgi:hypothetical protein